MAERAPQLEKASTLGSVREPSGDAPRPAPLRYVHPCRPPWFARGGHAQTMWGHLLPSMAPKVSTNPDSRRVEVVLEDGERLAVRALPGTSGVRVHLFHGLSGDVDSDYMRRATAALTARGHAVWCANHRGCGEGRGLAGRPYHSGSAGDVAAVLAASFDDDPTASHVAIGFSLSGNALLLAAARGLVSHLAGLVAVNPPVDIARASRDIRRGLSRLYELRFVHRLRAAIAQRERDGLARRRYAIPRTASLCEFDDLYTAPEAGFADGADYYRRCSSLPLLAQIAVPGVILTAADDPFVDPRVFGGAAIAPGLTLHVEPNGGHVAYLERRGAFACRWLDGALVHYVESLTAAG